MKALRYLAGPEARARIAREGLQPEAIAGVGAAAGGPKGLAFLGLDAWLFHHWLPAAPRARRLVGASIGAWRMAAAIHPDGAAATRRLGEAYLERQRYPLRPSPRQVQDTCREIVEAMLGDPSRFVNAGHSAHSLEVITARGLGALGRRVSPATLIRPVLANLRARTALGAHLQRVVFTRGDTQPVLWPTDRFDTRHVALSATNAVAALLASGTIPLIAAPVREIEAAPPGTYFDGGLVDYHLHLPWNRLQGIALLPHFTPFLTPGWLDKTLPWRKRGPRGIQPGLANVLLVTPSAALLARLPHGRLPDRSDFKRHGLNHDRRLQDWRRAMAECEAMVEDFASFVRHPDPARLEPLGA